MSIDRSQLNRSFVDLVKAPFSEFIVVITGDISHSNSAARETRLTAATDDVQANPNQETR